MLSLASIILGFMLIVIIHELGHFLTAKAFGIAVEQFGIGFGPRLFGFKFRNTLFSFHPLPLGGFVKICGMAPNEPVPEGVSGKPFYAARAYQKAIVLMAGVVLNVILGFAVFSTLFLTGRGAQPMVAEVAKNSPAEQAGLKPYDIITGFDDLEGFISHVKDHQGQTITLTVLRQVKSGIENKTVTIAVPSIDSKIGISLASAGFPHLSLVQSIKEAARLTVVLIVGILKFLMFLILGLFGISVAPPPGATGELQSIVGIGKIMFDIGQYNMLYQFFLLGQISINLAIFNILPIPALDGGHILMLIIEESKKLLGRLLGIKKWQGPLNPKVLNVINLIFFGLLLALGLVLIVRDIIRLN